MAISSIDTKILWGKAGGRCSAPNCDEDLTAIVTTGGYVVGEMAHVIGNKPTAARGIPEGGSDDYENLILLCPTHHRHIDKAPEGEYTVEMLQDWKKRHEAKISAAGKCVKYNSFKQLHIEVYKLLMSNKTIFDTYGPSSPIAMEDPNSNAFLIWELKRIDSIIPNNRKILNILDSNSELIEDMFIIRTIEEFRVHAESYEQHVYHRLDSYRLFPKEFSEVFS